MLKVILSSSKVKMLMHSEEKLGMARLLTCQKIEIVLVIFFFFNCINSVELLMLARLEGSFLGLQLVVNTVQRCSAKLIRYRVNKKCRVFSSGCSKSSFNAEKVQKLEEV